MTKKRLKEIIKTAYSKNHFLIIPLNKKREKMIIELKPNFMTWRSFHKKEVIND